MYNYILSDYNLSKLDALQTIFVSKYGLRHLKEAKKHPSQKWGHRVIAAIELTPFVGLIATIIEGSLAKYKRASSPSTPQNPWIFKGSQYGCSGKVATQKAVKVFHQLKQERASGIDFNENYIPSQIEGGTCSAMSLAFAEEYFKVRKKTQGLPNHQVLTHMKKIGKKFAKSNTEMRIRQAAFNTIQVTRPTYSIDYSKNKIQSLANLHHFMINYASEAFTMHSARKTQEIENEVAKLPEGTYFIRMIKPCDNEKLEHCGHSMVYIKENGLELFYDPNAGLLNLSGVHRAHAFSAAFKIYQTHSQLSDTRFYRLQASASLL
ncbi:putative uncharacterized protein [Parachlamydia acanthamoebae UV-7]|uniref:Uncharacterized protein n=2 Tax=Parachlamydia acanthamoebae TaxID=83552 RepID=F8KVC3_PARAV|nr:hypothetical protein [Parachlamydia acanthamoebae]CCB87645.1 putative uncharacterized protein [Parachlamydia acanthamoebae UV-7]